MQNAPMSGFPAQKKPLPLDQSTATQGPGLPPPPPPGVPDVPKTALSASNNWGAGGATTSQGGEASSPLSPLGPTSSSGGFSATQPPASSGPVSASPLDSFSAPSGTAGGTTPVSPPTLETFMSQQPAPLPSVTPYTGKTASLMAPSQTTQMESQATPQMPTGFGPTGASDGAGTNVGVPVGSAAANPGMFATPANPANPSALGFGPGSGNPIETNPLYGGVQDTWNAAHGIPNADGYTLPPSSATQLATQFNPGTGTNPNIPVLKPATDTTTQIPDTTGQKPQVNTTTTDAGGGNGPAPQPQAQPTVSTNPADYKTATTPYDQNITDWNTQLGAWLKQNMSNASPYSTDLIKQGQQVLEDAINRQTAAGQRQIEEYMASRGLTGSSLEAGTMKDYQAQMQEQYRQGMFQLGQAQVDAYLKQEQTVGSLASQYMSNLTDEQRNALSSVTSQMSLAMQKYGIDKSSADAAAQRETQKFIAEEGLVAQYGGTPSASEWDQFAAMFGPDDAKLYLGERPGGTTTSTTGTQPTTTGTGPATGGDNQYVPGTKPSTAPSDNPAMNSDIYNYLAINASNPDTLPMRQQRYDAFVQKWGADAATKNLGARPGATSQPATKLTAQQTQNWAALNINNGANMTTAQLEQVWDQYAKEHGQQDAIEKLGPRP